MATSSLRDPTGSHITGGDLLTKVEFSAGQAIFTENEPAVALFVIDSGSVRVTKRVQALSCQIETLGVGDVLGESALFSDATYSTRAIALEQTRCLRVIGQQFGEVVRRSPDIALRIMKKLALRLINCQYRLSNFTLQSGMARLMHQLVGEHERASNKKSVPLPYDLPDVLSLERGAVDDMIRELIRQSLLELGEDGTFSISDRPAFDRYLQYLELHDRFGRLDGKV